MNWLTELINKIFKKNQLKMLNEPLRESGNEEKNDFKMSLWRMAHLEACDGNGYGIYKIQKLEDML